MSRTQLPKNCVTRSNIDEENISHIFLHCYQGNNGKVQRSTNLCSISGRGKIFVSTASCPIGKGGSFPRDKETGARS
jgi:hypothetical protein